MRTPYYVLFIKKIIIENKTTKYKVLWFFIGNKHEKCYNKISFNLINKI